MGIIHPTRKSTQEHVVTGEVALDGSNPSTISLPSLHAAITGVSVSLKGSSAPGVGTSVLTYDYTAGSESGPGGTSSLDVYAWKVTGAGDATLIASTGTETVSYVVTGY